MALTIRDHSAVDMEQLKELTSQATASKAMLEAAVLLPGHLKEIKELKRKLQFLEAKHADSMAFVKDYTRALSNLTSLANGS